MSNPHIFGCSVVYFPGHGGNFVKLCLSLSPETVPHRFKDLSTLSDSECIKLHKLTAEQRFFETQYKSNLSYTKIHMSLRDPDIHYSNPLLNNHYQWAISGNHPEDIAPRLGWLKKILFLELDLEKYSHWIMCSHAHFKKNRLYFPEQSKSLEVGKLSLAQEQSQQMILRQPITDTLSMTEILNSQQGFEQQYQKACDILCITPVMDTAIKFYKSWRQLRVDPFLVRNDRFELPTSNESNWHSTN